MITHGRPGRAGLPGSVRGLLGLAALGWVLLPAGCASPDPLLYTLAATDPAVAAAPAVIGAQPMGVELRRVDIPAYLDRPEIVRSASDYRVHLASNDRWSEPLGDLVQRVLTDDLSRRLPGATVFSAGGAAIGPAQRVVEVQIARLDADGTGAVVLDARFVARGADADAPAVSRSVHLTAQGGAGDGLQAYAAAISAVTGQLADVIAGTIAAPPAS